MRLTAREVLHLIWTDPLSSCWRCCLSLRITTLWWKSPSCCREPLTRESKDLLWMMPLFVICIMLFLPWHLFSLLSPPWRKYLRDVDRQVLAKRAFFLTVKVLEDNLNNLTGVRKHKSLHTHTKSSETLGVLDLWHAPTSCFDRLWSLSGVGAASKSACALHGGDDHNGRIQQAQFRGQQTCAA